MLAACTEPEHKWLVLLGAYTGARLGEVSQLNLHTDIKRTAKGTHYFDITDEGDEDKKVKTVNARRQVPIHSALLDAGLLDWFEQVKRDGYARPFERLFKPWKGQWSKYPSKWFGEFKERVFADYPDEKRKKLVHHSFRHYVATSLKRSGVAEQHSGALLGHRSGGITYGRYGKGIDADDLKPTVETLITISI